MFLYQGEGAKPSGFAKLGSESTTSERVEEIMEKQALENYTCHKREYVPFLSFPFLLYSSK